MPERDCTWKIYDMKGANDGDDDAARSMVMVVKNKTKAQLHSRVT